MPKNTTTVAIRDTSRNGKSCGSFILTILTDGAAWFARTYDYDDKDTRSKHNHAKKRAPETVIIPARLAISNFLL